MGSLGGLAILAVAGLILTSQTSRAVPPVQDLEARSDVVAKVKVLAVVCLDHMDRYGLNSYQALLQIEEVKKGSVEKGETVLVRWRSWSKEPGTSGKVGLYPPRSASYFPGEEKTAHLKWDPQYRTYYMVWDHTREPDNNLPLRKLPDLPGQVMFAKHLVSDKK